MSFGSKKLRQAVQRQVGRIKMSRNSYAQRTKIRIKDAANIAN